jgi:hypothetical protein
MSHRRRGCSRRGHGCIPHAQAQPDIVQATGRAMRKADGKTTGYVLVPLFVEQAKGETIEEALARTEFDEVWNVMQAMQEQDDVLAEIIRQMCEERGRTKGFDDTRFREKVEICGHQVLLNTLREAISTRCLERLGHFWDEKFGQLQAFKDCYGHCNVPFQWTQDRWLGIWVANQRRLREKGRLKSDQIARLDKLGFIWSPRKAAWEHWFRKLAEYKAEHGDCDAPQNCTEFEGLGVWVSYQRFLRKRGGLGENEVQRLDTLGFVWDRAVELWERRYSELLAFRKQYGHCNVPDKWPENLSLGIWVGSLRGQKRKNILSLDRVRRLEQIGFKWKPYDSFWESQFRALVEYKKRHGNCDVPAKWPNDTALANWTGTQRSLRKAGRLAKDRIDRLNEVGFVWHQLDHSWEGMLAALAKYKEAYGNLKVSPKENPALSRWMDRQRQARRRGKLSRERTSQLKKLGFVWDALADRWEERFVELAAYKRAHGDCAIPTAWVENPALAKWVVNQRVLWKRGKLSLKRISRLNSIGFQWKGRWQKS